MEKILLPIYIQPGASKDEIVGWHGEPKRLKVKVSAPPVDGAANKQLIKFLSKKFGVPKSSIEIIRGHTSRNKDLLILNPSDRLNDLLKER